MNDLKQRVYAYLKTIPRGKVVTYGQIAQQLGDRRLARAVGNILHENPDPIAQPCYKVVNRDGRLAANFGDGGIAVQKKRLENDGIEVQNNKVDLAKYQWQTEKRLYLRPMKHCDLAPISAWLTDEVMMHKWCANEFTDFPLTAAALQSYYDARQERDDYFEFCACDESGLIGHFILEYLDREKKNLWLGFVVLKPEKRGNGLGKEMVRLAAKYAFTVAGAEKMTLAVFKNNPAAMHVYESLGFCEVPTDEPPLTVMGEIWDAAFMELSAQEYKRRNR